jgi:circadian clock protein KaiB
MNGNARFSFRLYVAGDGPNSMQAIANLRSLCEEFLPGRNEIELIDVLREPKRALDDGVLLTPTLVKLFPAPVRRIVGSLNSREPLLHALGLHALTQ